MGKARIAELWFSDSRFQQGPVVKIDYDLVPDPSKLGFERKIDALLQFIDPRAVRRPVGLPRPRQGRGSVYPLELILVDLGKHAKSLNGFIAKHLEPMFRWGSHLFSVAATVAAERCLADIANPEQLLAIRA